MAQLIGLARLGRDWGGDSFNWSVNFTGYEAGIGGAL